MCITYDIAGRISTSQLDNLAPFLYLDDSTHVMLDELKYPNTLVKKHHHHAKQSLIIGLDYQGFMGKYSPAQHEYAYDRLSRPTQSRNNSKGQLIQEQREGLEPIAPRPRAIPKNAIWYTYSDDLTKNVTELYKTDCLIVSTYDYTPLDGHWINRNRIGEGGGFNLYGFVGNNANCYSDYLGLTSTFQNVKYSCGDVNNQNMAFQ